MGMRSFRVRANNSRCLRCYQRREICICPILPTVQTRAEFLTLRHFREAERPSNTGRLVALAMPNSRIVSFGGGTRAGFPIPPRTWWGRGHIFYGLMEQAHGRLHWTRRHRSKWWFWMRHGARLGACIAVHRFCGRYPGWLCQRPLAKGNGCGTSIGQMACRHLRR